ncbi:MAG TPA: sigma-70 family RNA polymerase sigma factor [Candidatus Saccharimonadales bacterium]|jgi:RNA polymerase sigma-70 factor (ECF subfamily)|nr:sigma-70 family RNA polymerase sigma factor [Candidatus Saccharimonadales bacterium]
MDAEAVAVLDRPWTRVNGIPAAFEQLFRAEYARVVRIAYRVVGDQGAAEDVAQDVFIAYYRAHAAGAPYAAPWLHRAAAHTALNAVRSRARRTAREERDALGRDTSADPEGAALERERAREVRAALARMPRAYAELLALRYSGLSYAEVAAATGTKIDQIGTRLRRAHDAFRKEVLHGQHR